MTILSFLLQIIAVIALFCAALKVSAPRVELQPLGLALWLLSLMVSGVVLHAAQ